MSIQTVPAEVVSLLRDKAARTERLGILAGAGISKRAPSNLPTAGEMMYCMLDQLLSPEVFLSSVDLLNAERPSRRSPKDFLRFELLAQSLAIYAGDRHLTFLNYLANCQSPNRNHDLLAGMMGKGHPVLTTNFEGLIEAACVRRGFQPVVLAEDAAFRKWSPNKSMPTLFKLHGTFELEGRNRRDSLRATLQSIVRTGDADVMLEESKFNVFSRIISSHDLLVLGYSGADDYDILPALQKVHTPGRRIIWINHTPGLENCRLSRFSDLAGYARDSHGFFLAARVKLLDVLVREGMRNADDVFLVDCDTDEVITLLAELYGIEWVPDDAPPYKVNLEQFFAQWCERYLPQVSERWYIGSTLLFERERYQDALRLLDQVIADSVGNADRLVKASQAKVNYFLRHSDYTSAETALASIVDAVKSLRARDVEGMYWHQFGYVQFNLGEHALFNYQWQAARSYFQAALPAYQKALQAWKDVGDVHSRSATLHQMGMLFARFHEPERLEGIYKAQMESFQFIRIIVSRETIVDRTTARLQKFTRSLQPRIHQVQQRWYLRKSLRCFMQAMDLAKKAGLWERYCESASQMASVLHLARQYAPEVKVLTEAYKRASVLGKAYITGGIIGQLGFAFIFLEEYTRAHAALVLALRLTQEGGGVHAGELQSALQMLRNRVANTAFSAQDSRFGSLQNTELLDIVLEGQKAGGL